MSFVRPGNQPGAPRADDHSHASARHHVTDEVLKIYLTEALTIAPATQTLLLGCTHYPLLKPAIQQIVSPNVLLVDSAESCAQYVRRRLHEADLLTHSRRRKGHLQPFVTDEADRFEDAAERFLGVPIAAAAKVELPPYVPRPGPVAAP